MGRTGTGRYCIDTEVTSLRVAVIGAGRLGASLALALRTRGLPLVAYTAHTAAGRLRADSWLGGSALTKLEDVVAQGPDLYLLTVPDTALPQVATQLARILQSPSAAFVVHTSGATSIRELDPCALRGAVTLAFHPLQTFSDPTGAWQRFEGTAVAITPESGDEASTAGSFGFSLARLLDARPFLLADGKRALYHAAATMACNYFVTLEHQARSLFVDSGLPSEEALQMFLPLVRATLDNITTQGTVKALTGPLSRGDVQTVRRHLAALSTDAPEVSAVYRALGLATLELVRTRRDVEPSTIEELAGLLSASPGNHPPTTQTERIHP